MDDTSPAHVLFPSDAPTQPPAEQGQPSAAPPRPDAHSAPQAVQAQGEDAGKLFPSEAPPQERDTALEPLDRLADTVRFDDAGRAEALNAAGDALFLDAVEWGTPTETLREITGQLHEASATLSPMSAEQIADLNAKAYRELSDVPAADLDLARGLVTSMAMKIPGLGNQLEASGLGSDPKFVRLIVAEAKRRAASHR